MQETIDELFPTTPDTVRAILGHVRQLVRDALSEAEAHPIEIYYHGALGYGTTASGFDRILYVVPQNGYVNLGFFYGVGVADPTGLLEGTGKRMRHIKIKSVQATQNPALIPLLRDAWAHGIVAVAQIHASRKKQA